MELRDYLRLLSRRWLVIALLTALGGATALGISLTTTPEYAARAQVFVSLRGGADTTGDLLQGANFTLRQVRSYVQIVTTPSVLQPVIDELGLDETPTTLARRVSADSPVDTVLINVRVNCESAAMAASIANAVANSLAEVVAELEAPVDGEPPVQVSTVRPADVPEAPASPNTVLNLAVGLLVGLALGVGVALLRELLDTRVRDVADVEALTDSSVLGAIPVKDDAVDHPLILHEAPGSPRAEAYRRLRTNLAFLDVDRQQRAIVFTSSVAGEGKTSTVLNLGITIANAGSRVAVVDADLRRPSVAKYLGIEGSVGLTTVLIGQAVLDDVVQPWGNDHLHVIASGAVPPNPSELLSSERMAAVIAELVTRYDVVLVDTAPLLPVTDGAVLARLVGGAVAVAGVGTVHKPQFTAALEALEAVSARVLGVVVNRVPAKGTGSYAYGYYDYMSTADTGTGTGAGTGSGAGTGTGSGAGGDPATAQRPPRHSAIRRRRR